MAIEPIHASIMGCTSSAPNMATNQNATEKIIEFSDDDEGGLSIKEDKKVISTIEENGVNETKVLPCDTLPDTIQLDSNNKSVIDTSDLDTDKDIPTIDDLETEDTKAKESKDKLTEEKLTSLEDVVEKVVELYVSTDNLSNSTHDMPEQIPNKIQEIIEKTTKVETDRISDKTDECENDHREQTEESPEEALSPSQSTSSRATRWEALADIAAELPPSLTVDPLTGQIYALSK